MVVSFAVTGLSNLCARISYLHTLLFTRAHMPFIVFLPSKGRPYLIFRHARPSPVGGGTTAGWRASAALRGITFNTPAKFPLARFYFLPCPHFSGMRFPHFQIDFIFLTSTFPPLIRPKKTTKLICLVYGPCPLPLDIHILCWKIEIERDLYSSQIGRY